MESQSISFADYIRDIHGNSLKGLQRNKTNFQATLDSQMVPDPGGDSKKITIPASLLSPPGIQSNLQLKTASNEEAIAAYKKQETPDTQFKKISDLAKYKDDQLLSNPGGDHYYLDEKKVVPHPEDQESFLGRLTKDISDAFSNVKNFFHNLLFGSTIRYRDKNNQIQEATQRGLVGSVVDFFKDLGSAFSFGMWRPDGENEPQGFGERVGFFFSKIKEAIFGDLVQGVTGSVIHMGEDLIFAGWNLLETIPDATIGNFKIGKKITTAIFDTGQVVLDYLTDILPSGDAWVRVHSAKLKGPKPPIYHNITMPEHHSEDVRWRYVRNTPFRKTIETIGSILTDVLSILFLGKTDIFSNERHNRN